MFDRMSDHMSDRMSDRMSDHMSDCISDRSQFRVRKMQQTVFSPQSMCPVPNSGAAGASAVENVHVLP